MRSLAPRDRLDPRLEALALARREVGGDLCCRPFATRRGILAGAPAHRRRDSLLARRELVEHRVDHCPPVFIRRERGLAAVSSSIRALTTSPGLPLRCSTAP